MASTAGRLLIATTAILIAGCAPVAEPGKVGKFQSGTAEIGYVAPRVHDTSPARVAGATVAEAAQNVAGRLRKAGLSDVNVDAASGTVTASSRSPQFIDCGILDTGGGGNARYAASTARSAIAMPGADPTGFVWRIFNSETRFQVMVQPSGGGFKAHVTEIHRARITLRSTDQKRVLEREEIEFTESKGARFSSGLICGSAGLVRRILD